MVKVCDLILCSGMLCLKACRLPVYLMTVSSDLDIDSVRLVDSFGPV